MVVRTWMDDIHNMVFQLVYVILGYPGGQVLFPYIVLDLIHNFTSFMTMNLSIVKRVSSLGVCISMICSYSVDDVPMCQIAPFAPPQRLGEF